MRIEVVLVVVIGILTPVRSNPGCSEHAASLVYNKPIYEFSMKILHRVSVSERGSFVLSPISTWLQLLHLSEGSKGSTAAQLKRVTGRGNTCFQRMIGRVIKKCVNNAEDVLLRSYMVIDDLLDVKPTYKAKIKHHQSLTELVTVNFNDPPKAEYTLNRLLKQQSRGEIRGLFEEDDFKNTILLFLDVVYLKMKWLTPFDPLETTRELFHTQSGEAAVDMMTQLGVFNVTKLPTLNMTVLELPCDFNDRIKMLLIQTDDLTDLYTVLAKTRLKGIFNSFKRNPERTVRVSMPKFSIRNEIDYLPELLFDMGVKDVFDPYSANLKGISDYRLYASSMKQIASIEVNEGSVTAAAAPGFMANAEDVMVFKLNKPFGFMIVDKAIEIILFGGVYMEPNDD